MISIRLDDFKSNIGKFLRGNRFSISIDNTLFDEREFYTCKGSAIPGKTFGEVELCWQGYKYKILTDVQFNDITFHFYNTIDQNGIGIRDKFETWFNIISGEDNIQTPHDLYKSTVHISQLDNLGNTVKTYVLLYAHPKEISEIELSMDSADQVEEFTVTFSFTRFIIE